MGANATMTRAERLAWLTANDRRCSSYTVKGHRCKRAGTCWSVGSGRLCLQHMREAEPGGFLWL